ncbi:DNA polymerase IV [Paracoccus sp. MC1862]|uniref:DNA polymerase IV n=1 Tax=Paracoccus sp. MC1862 TaxID=2760307 RepID=UPI0016034952|nr:DNA polymerase IV [Paracoccus sp. MC1862]MBB1498327.1 DNA polymerase IV [Paracoccus sp. MC1862]QQO44917.1 DNA polymerase IV [Paracoccus sp. MC1862]
MIPDAPGRIRRIVHIDMDAFFASVEQRDNPDLRGKPVAVGGSSLRGVVAAASYEARPFGVHSAMPSVRAKRLCPELIFVKGRFEVYRAVSNQIREIFARFTPLIEPLSLDEAYLDLTDHLEGRTATAIAQEIRALIRLETGLTASAGVSYNKFLAKLASDQRKPDGLYVIPPEAGPGFVLTLPIARFHGIGPATAARMERHGIRTGADLHRQSLEFLTTRFGKAGRYYWNIARGIDDREVRPNRERKSIGAETTFFTDIHDLAAAAGALEPLAEKVWRHAGPREVSGRTVTLKAKYTDFQIVTRAHSQPAPVMSQAELLAQATALLPQVLPDPRGVRLLGITLSSLCPLPQGPQPEQLDLFG